MREIAERKKSFYKNKVHHLRNTDSRRWWRTINKMSGKPNKSKSFSLECNGEILNDQRLASTLNEFYVSVNADIPTLDVNSLPTFLPAIVALAVQPHEVCEKFLALKPHKATGPDNVPSRILKTSAHVLAEPVTIIFNAPLSSSVFPKIWKKSNIIPISKVQQHLINKGDTRPISLTSCLSKVLEDFVVSWLIDDVKGN